jgi:cell division protein FtsL
MAETFEYAIKKDVRNNPIVREIDSERHRELWRSVVVGVLLVSGVLFYTWQHFELVRYGYRLEEMQQQRAVVEDRSRHLRLEIETLRSLERIERIALEDLQMVSPAPGDTSVIEWVMPWVSPPYSVVASR